MASVEVLVILSSLAIGMTAISAVSVKWAAFAAGPLRKGTVLFLLLMMAGMFVGVLVYFAIGGVSGIVAGLWVSAAIMSASVVLVVLSFLAAIRSPPSAGSPDAGSAGRRVFVVSVVGLVILNEFLMGWSFSLLSGSLPVGLGPGGRATFSILSGAIVSPWFVFPMALEMVLTLRWLLEFLPRAMSRFLLLQPAVMVCSPPTLHGEAWVAGTAVGASALMGLAVAFWLVALIQDQKLTLHVTRYLESLLGSFGLMAAGLYIWVAFGDSAVFAAALLVQMAVFLFAVVEPARSSAVSTAPGGRPAEELPASRPDKS